MRLRYLVTYAGEDHLVAQERLAAVALFVADHHIVTGDALWPGLRDHADRLQVTGYDLGRDEQQHPWRALARPFQLSLTFAVELVPAEFGSRWIQIVGIAESWTLRANGPRSRRRPQRPQHYGSGQVGTLAHGTLEVVATMAA